MTSLKTAFLVLSLLGVLSAFNVSTYLYPSEKNVVPTYTNFTLNGSNYSIVAIGGTNTFLLQDGNLVLNATSIAPAIQAYYIQAYYPSGDQLANLSALIKVFNDSRNDGYDFKNKEEYTCRNDVIFNGKITLYGTRAQLTQYGTPITCKDPDDNTSCTTPLECRNNASCTRLASLVGGHYCQANNIICSSKEAIGIVTNFSIASYEMDDILGNYTSLLANLTPDSVASTLQYIKDTAPTLKKDSLMVEATYLRVPRLNDSADRTACLNTVCYELCPSLDLNQAVTDQIAALAGSLASAVAPLKNYQGVADQLAASTSARLDFAKTEATAEYYSDQFAMLNASGSTTIALGQQAKAHVSSMALTDSLDKLIALQSTIPEDIAAKNFTNIDNDLADYRSTYAVVKNISRTLLAGYNATLAAKNDADSVMLVLQTKDSLDPSGLETFGILQNRTADLDASFRDGYTPDQLELLRQKYANITAEAQDLLNSESNVPATRAILLFRGFARRVNVGIDRLATATGLADAQSVVGNPLLSFGSFSLLVFLSLSALSALFFMFLAVTFNLDVPQSRVILGAAFLCTLVVFLIFGVFLYLFLDKTAVSATFTEFLSDFSSRNSTSIVLDLRNVSYADSQSMVTCAKSLSGVIAADNKTWSIYTLTPGSCTVQNQSGGNSTMSADACLAGAANQSSTFVLGYAPQTQQPQFSIIYRSEADITANSDYYKSCPLVALFG